MWRHDYNYKWLPSLSHLHHHCLVHYVNAQELGASVELHLTLQLMVGCGWVYLMFGINMRTLIRHNIGSGDLVVWVMLPGDCTPEDGRYMGCIFRMWGRGGMLLDVTRHPRRYSGTSHSYCNRMHAGTSFLPYNACPARCTLLWNTKAFHILYYEPWAISRMFRLQLSVKKTQSIN